MKEAVNLQLGMIITLEEVTIQRNTMIENMEVLHMEPIVLT